MRIDGGALCGMQLPPTPPVDPANEEFVLFIRATKFPQWYPLSVVKGGAQANVLLRAMQNDLGKLLYGKTLIRNIGSVSSAPYFRSVCSAGSSLLRQAVSDAASCCIAGHSSQCVLDGLHAILALCGCILGILDTICMIVVSRLMPTSGICSLQAQKEIIWQ